MIQQPPFNPDNVPDDFVRMCEEHGMFQREKELVLELTETWSDHALRELIKTLKERHDLE